MITRKLFLAAAALALLGLAPQPAHAQFGPCFTSDGPCSGLVDQIAQYARQFLQLEQEITTAEQEVIAAINLPGALFQDITGPIQNITNLAKQADLLAGNTGAFIGNLSASTYPLPNNGMQQLILHSNAIANAISTLGQVLDAENPRLAAAAATIASLTAEALGDPGRMAVLQDSSQMHAAHVQQSQALEAIKMAEGQAQHATLLADHDRRAMADQWGDLAATSYAPYPMTGQAF